MRFVPTARIKCKQFEPHELLFLDCWYGLTHDKSLDSHRVKCLNARTVVRELCEELEIGRLDDEEFFAICSEASSILECDIVINVCFPKGTAALLPFLASPPLLPGSSKADKSKPENQTRLRHLRFAATDLEADLESRYFSALCKCLKDALDAKDTQTIESLTNSMLSDLIARGWPLRALFAWHEKFLSSDGYTFADNFEFVVRQLQRPPDEFRVALRISGGKNVRKLGAFRDFTLSTECPIQVEHEYERAFAKSDDFTTFAWGRFYAVDFSSAAIIACEEIEPLLDSLRFRFEPGLLEIERESLVIRDGDHRRMIVSLSNPVPNPIEVPDEDDFNTFSEKLSHILGSRYFEEESKNRLETALRRYRAGRDSHNYSEKFLNWWMGLEALTNVGGTRIGRTVTENVSRVMLTGYLFRLLRDFVITLNYLRIDWTESFRKVSLSDSLQKLNVPGLLRLLQDPSLSCQLLEAIGNRPLVQVRGQRLVDWVSQPNKLYNQLSSHLRRLTWHLSRLYRIRCCLVHGSSVRFRLPLFSANLEYYLQQAIIFTIESLHENPHIADLSSLFQRNLLMWDRRLELLKSGKASKDAIADTVFCSVVERD